MAFAGEGTFHQLLKELLSMGWMVIPLHDPIEAKTLSTILKSVTRHQGIDIQELLRKPELQ